MRQPILCLPGRLLSAIGLAVGMTGSFPSVAAPAPGLELQEKVPVAPLTSDPGALPSYPPPSPPAGAQAGDETHVVLRGIRLEGNRTQPTGQLLARLGPVDGQRFTLDGLNRLAETLTAHYRQLGYPLARAVLPAQRLNDGILVIQIIEGTVGRTQALGDDPKVSGAQPFLQAGIPDGSPIRSGTLERTMLLLDDQPGFQVRPVLKPGQAFGETDLAVQVTRRNHVSGEIGFDNTGNVNTGEHRLRGALEWNSPFRFGDQLSLTAMLTDESLWLGSLEYETPLGAHGLRAAVGWSRSSYQLGREFAVLDASGIADTALLRLSYPWVRSQRANLLASATLAHKRLEQRYAALDLERERRADSVTLALQFDHRDGWGGGGITYGQVSLAGGELEVDDASRLLDDVTAGTAGGFHKLNLDMVRIQKLPGVFSAYGRVSAQWTDTNLDPSEKFSLGGFLGVRAYPMGEGSGDRGWLLQTELRAAVDEQLTGFLWWDGGQVRLNAEPWDDSSAGKRQLAGAGLGARWLHQRWRLEGTLGWRVHGGRPEAESRDRNPRLFVAGSYRY
ncbi:ShlB/FhaC/HecB family hemolysin secretion/activation protein [Chitiniphilus purpureus]|uniref:ShlB/FhaC/HecB family hemolysin secretion/activation protein n=1 Tax=Chitiniphilus purpureus TaxID=2981137 RepID=A0ABY6DM57_9NEIS|nr:ShlB/FhaC/HecB family hemolysin secretion/activation protein [Chitiniphilus sp. CD1]UXY15450.1 ShlB/FhaC/HecB family hemolysin secretion/activation protein [Chitiniphilus sp. CD1]